MIVIPYYDPVQSLVAYFKKNKAISPSSAILLSTSDWVEAGVESDPTTSRWNSYKLFLKKTGGGKVYLSEEGLKEYITRESLITKKIVMVFLAVVIFFILFMFYLFVRYL